MLHDFHKKREMAQNVPLVKNVIESDDTELGNLFRRIYLGKLIFMLFDFVALQAHVLRIIGVTLAK